MATTNSMSAMRTILTRTRHRENRIQIPSCEMQTVATADSI